MKFCPKCRSFYDDAGLAFCFADGIPLVEINQSNALWNDGNRAVETSRRIIQKQTRRQKITRISRILIMSVMMILVISVIAMNIYINLPPKTDEKVVNILPSPTISPTVEPTAQTIIEQIPSPTTSPTESISPSPIPSPTPTVSPTTTETPSPTKTPTITPKPTTPIPPGDPCIPQFANERPILLNRNASFFLSSIERERGEIIQEYQRKHRKPATAELTLSNTNALYRSCFKADVIVSYFWTIIPQSAVGAVKEQNITLPTKQKSFSCQKSNGWSCSEL
ncbi:MAG TPA: hypothetical protein PKE69_13780 [Pyrinomonadaceae bacterium]|nr:hypothetical protein [Pyrinomonadaceae bacterium]